MDFQNDVVVLFCSLQSIVNDKHDICLELLG